MLVSPGPTGPDSASFIETPGSLVGDSTPSPWTGGRVDHPFPPTVRSSGGTGLTPTSTRGVARDRELGDGRTP